MSSESIVSCGSPYESTGLAGRLDVCWPGSCRAVGGSAGEASPRALVDRWAGRDVLVVGDAMLDEWRFAEASRLCREAPVPVLSLRRRAAAAGGAGNAAVNLARLGAQVVLVAPVGDDAAGGRLRSCLARDGVGDRTVVVADRATPLKRRLVAGDQIVVREDEGEPAPLPEQVPRRMLAAVRAAARAAVDPVLVVCDHGSGAFAEPVRSWLVAHREMFSTVALDAHDLRAWPGLAPTLVTPSFAEAARALGLPSSPGERPAAAAAWLAALAREAGAELVAVTIDQEGAVVAGRDGRAHRTYADPAPASHAVGAGDAFLAAATLAIAAGAAAPVAADCAQLAATLSVSGEGTCVCGRDALLAAAAPRAEQRPEPDRGGTAGPPATAAGVVDPAGLAGAVREHRDRGARVVFTNGCFDVLHRGHIACLEQARQLGDLLVVAVNSDAGVRRLKGPDRPVNRVEDRVAVLAALSCVDLVVVFDDESPAGLIGLVRPDVYVKGGDYPPELVPEGPLVRRLGGRVHIAGYVPDRSTSAVIERIRTRHAGTPSEPHPGS